MTETRCCPYCQRSFHPSPYRLQQRVCSQPECQRHRRADYHRRKIQADPVYAQVVLDSRKQWRAEHADYQKTYWRTHPEAAERNRQRQRQLDRQRRVTSLVSRPAAISTTKPAVLRVFYIGTNNLESRRTRHPTAEWMIQVARNAADEGSGFLRGMRYLLHDRDTFLDVLWSSGIRPLALPPRSPNLNAFSGHWVCSLRQECLSKLILFGEASLRRALTEYIEHHHFERNHQGKGNLLLFPSPDVPLSPKSRTVRCRDRLGGLLKFYSRVA